MTQGGWGWGWVVTYPVSHCLHPLLQHGNHTIRWKPLLQLHHRLGVLHGCVVHLFGVQGLERDLYQLKEITLEYTYDTCSKNSIQSLFQF